MSWLVSNLTASLGYIGTGAMPLARRRTRQSARTNVYQGALSTTGGCFPHER